MELLTLEELGLFLLLCIRPVVDGDVDISSVILLLGFYHFPSLLARTPFPILSRFVLVSVVFVSFLAFVSISCSLFYLLGFIVALHCFGTHAASDDADADGNGDGDVDAKADAYA